MAETNQPTPGPFTAEGQPTLQQLTDYFVERLYHPDNLKRLEAAHGNAAARAAVVADAAIDKAQAAIGWDERRGAIENIVKLLISATDVPESLLDPITRGAIESLLKEGEGSEHGVENAGGRLIAKLSGTAATVEPGIEGAARYLTLFINESTEALLRSVALEIVTEYGPKLFGVGGGIENLQRLQEVVEHALGGDRMVRRVLQPFITATAIRPAQWHVNKRYRPELLSPADTVRQWMRGRWSLEQRDEELARQGFSAGRIDALVNAQRKFFSPANVRTFVERQHWTSDQGVQHLRDQGYEEPAAVDALRLEGLSIFESHEATEATAIIGAYASHDIERGDFLALLQTFIGNERQRALYEELGELRRRLFIKHLSATQAEQAVKAGILAYRDYREALVREGYDDQAITVLELQLRYEIDKQTSIDKHRQELFAERAAEKAQRDAAAAARKAEVERDRALRRRGSLSDLERAAVRGLIPFARVEEVLAAEYDPDTVEILVGLMEQDRQTYLAQQAAAEQARARGARREVDVGTLEQAVYDNLLTIEAFEQRLGMLRFDPADAALLADVVAARKRDLDAAKAKRDDAERAARNKSIDLGRFERLVRLGARSFDDYDALLESLGYDEAARAAMRELLEIEVANDRAADEARAAAEAKLRAKGLSFDQFRRAVILGLKTVDQFNTFLVNQGFTADAIETLVAEVEEAAADAESARRKRAAGETAGREPALSLPTVARAARLGILDPADYQARLVAAGYSADEVAIEMELLAVEIADTQAARARRDLLEADTGERGLSLREVEQAVKAGLASFEDYRARALTLNYNPDDVELLVALLEDELAAKAAGAPPEQ